MDRDRDNKKYPTFKLEPEDEERYFISPNFTQTKIPQRFYPSRVRKILQATLEERLKREEFDVQNIPSLSDELVRLVRYRVRGIVQKNK